MAGVGAGGLAPRPLAAVAGAAIAVATVCAMTAVRGGPDRISVLVAVGLAATVWRVSRSRSVMTLPPGKDVLVLAVATLGGYLGLHLLGWDNLAHRRDIAEMLTLGVVLLAILWPEPNILRYCVVLAAGSLIGVPAGPLRLTWAVGGAVAALAVAIVATHRLATATAARLGEAPPAPARRLATEALAVLAIVGLLAALVASLLPPPPGRGGGRSASRRLPSPSEPAVRFEDRLDAGAGHGKPDDGYVLLVRAREPDVWRALTYDHWDGEAWSRSPSPLAGVQEETVRPGIGDPPSDPAQLGLFQSVTVLAGTADVLAAAAVPTNALAPGVGVEQDLDASLHPARPLQRGAGYVVFSDQHRVSAGALRALGDTPAGAVPTDVADAYLQLPEVSPKVRALAAQIVAGRPTTFDRTQALERWIDDHTRVTPGATPVAAGADPLETFLIDEKEGPPERAATAMAVMLRALGVPARIAVGFLPGERSEQDGGYLVRASDSTAWVEVWFPGAGWQRFDPTGRAPDPRAPAESVWDRLLRFLRKLWPLLVAVLLIAGAWLARQAASWQRRRAALPWATRFEAQLERAGRARGRPRRPQETPTEYATGLAATVLPDPRLPELGQLVTTAAWSRHEPPAEARARAEAVLAAATRAAPAGRRGRRRRSPPAVTRSRPTSGPTIAQP